MKKNITFLIFCLLLTATAFCETSIWVAKTDSSTTYIGGTIHLLHPSDKPYPSEYDSAYNKSEMLVFEVDFSDVESPEFTQRIIAQAIYPDSLTLESVLNEEALDKVKKYCSRNSLPFESIKRMKPWMLSITLLMMELQKLGVEQQGIDTYYYRKASAEKKSMDKLETIDEQIEVLTSLGVGNESEYIIYGLDDLDKLAEQFNLMVESWKAGDDKAMYDLMIKEVKEKFPKVYQSVFVDRNMNWVPKIEEYILTPETEFILVGTGHLIGNDGVIAQLKKLGYTVEKYK